MNLAIFMDAHAVCGDARLLKEVQRGLMRIAIDNDAMLSRFAAAINSFGSSHGWWNRLLSRGLGHGEGEQQLNLKKEGIFPLVHGVRSLALAYRVTQISTTSRIEALVADGKLESSMGTDLTDSLQFFMGLKLTAGLAELDKAKAVTGTIDVARLSTLDRDLLKDTLGIVKQCKPACVQWLAKAVNRSTRLIRRQRDAGAALSHALVGQSQARVAALPPG